MTAVRRPRAATRHLQLVRDEPPEPHEVTATPDWPPVAIPGRPGWRRQYVDGQQVDLPHDQEGSSA